MPFCIKMKQDAAHPMMVNSQRSVLTWDKEGPVIGLPVPNH